MSAPSRPSEFFDALIDTGFTGFVQLPERKARELGLAPQASSETQYADGRIETIPLTWASVALGPEVQEGFVHLQRGSNEAIVGVELLRIFHKTLVLSISKGGPSAFRVNKLSTRRDSIAPGQHVTDVKT